MESTPFWGKLREAASQPDQGGLGLWAWLKEKVDLALYRPEAAAGVVASQLTGREGDYYVLKNPQTRTYYRLSDRDQFLWQLMDGSRSMKDLGRLWAEKTTMASPSACSSAWRTVSARASR